MHIDGNKSVTEVSKSVRENFDAFYDVWRDRK